MKLFKVSIDNNPGGWKSGEDPSVLVVANDKGEAIQKVKDGWDAKWDYTDGEVITTYKKMTKEFSYVRNDSQFSASEILFDGYDLHIKSIRKAKLDRIDKHIKRDESR